VLDPAGAGALALKAAFTAAVVVTASIVAERSRPAVAAAILSLPVSVGPAYVLLALQHPSEFIARAALVSLPANLATIALVLAYAPLARAGAPVWLAFPAAFLAWCAASAAILSADWSLPAGIAALAVTFAIAIPATRTWRGPGGAVAVVRRWYDLPLRAGLVATVVVSVVALSDAIGPSATGLFALFPTAYSSFILLMHGRLGGTRLASALASGIVMLPGLCLGIVALAILAGQGFVWAGIAGFLIAPALFAIAVLVATRPRSA